MIYAVLCYILNLATNNEAKSTELEIPLEKCSISSAKFKFTIHARCMQGFPAFLFVGFLSMYSCGQP